MPKEKILKKCEMCGKEFEALFPAIRYCGSKCRRLAIQMGDSESEAGREYDPRLKACMREDCQMYNIKIKNRCNGLAAVPYVNCAFYKKKGV